MARPLRGHVFRYDFGPGFGAELAGLRAALIIGNDEVNEGRQNYIALPTTTSMPERGRLRNYVRIEDADDWAATQRLATIRGRLLGDYVGYATPFELTAVVAAITRRLHANHNLGKVPTPEGKRTIQPGTVWETCLPNDQDRQIDTTILVVDYNDGNGMAVTVNLEFPPRGPNSKVAVPVTIQEGDRQGSAILNQIRSICVPEYEIEPAGKVSNDDILAAVRRLLTIIDRPAP